MRINLDIPKSVEDVSDRQPDIINNVYEQIVDGPSLILFSTKTCPNCKQAARYLSEQGIVFKKIFAEDEPGLVDEYQIMQAPTLVDTKTGQKVVGVGPIRRYVMTL